MLETHILSQLLQKLLDRYLKYKQPCLQTRDIRGGGWRIRYSNISHFRSHIFCPEKEHWHARFVGNAVTGKRAHDAETA